MQAESDLAHPFAVPRLSLVTELGVYYFGGQSLGVSGRLVTATLGPRVTIRSEHGLWKPFAQFLAGGARLSARTNTQSTGETGFAMIAGGGVDARFRRQWAIRCLDVDYLMTRFNGSAGSTTTQNDLRVTTGVVFRFGPN